MKKNVVNLNVKQLNAIIKESVHRIMEEAQSEGIDFSNPEWSDEYFNSLTQAEDVDGVDDEYNRCYEDLSGYIENASKEYDVEVLGSVIAKLADEFKGFLRK